MTCCPSWGKPTLPGINIWPPSKVTWSYGLLTTNRKWWNYNRSCDKRGTIYDD